ncbi:hypothetical protein DEJ30_04140 [Curtobacterium sp. MCPF17_003]|nr:hypothetical protein DEJ30_04140 [Curtobacterium sp. MCPF17_003]PZE70646.1 hypothetical protein DEJ27_06135 [Curtobacterium sp. MCPF17_018]
MSMNEFTYYCLASVQDGTGENLWAWTGNIEKRRRRPLGETREWLLGVLGRLLERDLVCVGNFEENGTGRAGWETWTGSVEAVVDRVASIYTVDLAADEVQYWPCYLMRTEAGAQLYGRERSRRELADEDPVPRLRAVWDEDGNVIEEHGDEIVV